ncbi:AAA family ATPase [uncultured Kordia sp.]|uniref:ATP-dependent nuclease n=1 Tax=uncultured Kordia sp. TaxID=507699 RepID=UPI002622D370|nr:AAA family ATPase [uncultured Kordia sp.]
MYLSYIKVENYKGIDTIETEFDPNINIIIGENGSCKSALIDAIRILYNIGEPIREISVSSDDFHQKIMKSDTENHLEKATLITITYIFKGLSTAQKGAFYEYMVIDPNDTEDDYAKIIISYEEKNGKYPQFSYNTGDIDGQKADFKTFELFQHYYLSALRDSTRDLLNTRGNVLGRVIKRFVKRNETESEIEQIVKDANSELLDREEVKKTRSGINNNLEAIFKKFLDNKIGLRIAESKTEYIVNAIKPFLPHDRENLSEEGFNLWQNSLGLNNLIYIAIVLGDVKEQIEDNNIPHYALLIEEPEAHLHPQLQLSLYNFLTGANTSDNSQLFITTHSPTLTSKVPLKNLILLDHNKAYKLEDQFEQRVSENIIESTTKNVALIDSDFKLRQRKLERYIDVTKSQLFYAKSILFVEGISEELLLSAFTRLEDYLLEDYRVELVNVKGTSFYPFLYLFNHQDENKRINKPITVLTDDDRFTSSKEAKYSFNKLLETDYSALDELDSNIQNGTEATRIANLNSVANNVDNIKILHSFKTLEYELAIHNIEVNRTELHNNFLFDYINQHFSDKIDKIIEYTQTFENDIMSESEKRKVGILLWKSLPKKAEFAQDFSIYIIENIDKAKTSFVVPKYIQEGLTHLRQGI